MIDVYSSSENFLLPLGSEVRQAEIKYCEQKKIPTYTLMQRAGFSLWRLIKERFSQAESILIITGPGNNGGDGFEVAFHAMNSGKKVKLRYVSRMDSPDSYCQSISGDAATALKAIQQKLSILPLQETDFVECDLIVDALLGTGIQAPAREEFSFAIELINQSGVPVLSVDVPSGLDADLARKVGTTVEASCTLTFIGIKPGLVTGAGKECCGQLLLDTLDVENISSLIKEDRKLTTLFDAKKTNNSRGRRNANSHKGDFGRTLIIGGNLGMGGAAMLSAAAACKAGSGAVIMITRPQHVAAMLAQHPEVMVVGTDSGTDSDTGKLALEALNSATAIVVGPGLGRDQWAEFWLRKALSISVNKVVDADGLHLAKKLSLSLEGVIMTPHPGEAFSLLSIESSSNNNVEFSSADKIQNNRYHAAQILQQQYKATVVLKGAGTLIVSREHSKKLITRVCPYGNPGMATAGMGDVLAGVIGALLSQGVCLTKAAVVGTLIHSLAADRAASEMPIGLMASDLLSSIRSIRNEIDL